MKTKRIIVDVELTDDYERIIASDVTVISLMYSVIGKSNLMSSFFSCKVVGIDSDVVPIGGCVGDDLAK